MLTITSENVTEHETHKFCVEASDLGLRPGELPRLIRTTLGNGQPFVLEGFDESAMWYRQVWGCITLTVFND